MLLAPDVHILDMRGGSRPKLKGGQLGEGVPKTKWNFFGRYSRKFSGFFAE